jgi:hypothetical protein
MNKVYITFYHPHLDIISDRTFRTFIKNTSKVVREIITDELQQITDELGLSLRERQSLKARLRNNDSKIVSYYLESVERGSLALTLSITAVGLWLLQQTLGETIKEAWKQSQLHEKLIDYLTKKRRIEWMEQELRHCFPKEKRFDRYVVESFKKEITANNDLHVHVILMTPDEIIEELENQFKLIDEDYVIAEGKRLIEEIRQDLL